MDISAKITEATETAEVLDIIYHGGSQPGKTRKIAPISVKNGKVRARCYSSNAVKTFNLEKIELVTGSAEAQTPGWNPNFIDQPKYEVLSQLHDAESQNLVELGWHIQIEEDHLTLHRKFKNGKPLKGADVELYYEEYSFDIVMGLDGEFHQENLRKRTRS